MKSRVRLLAGPAGRMKSNEILVCPWRWAERSVMTLHSPCDGFKLSSIIRVVVMQVSLLKMSLNISNFVNRTAKSHKVLSPLLSVGFATKRPDTTDVPLPPKKPANPYLAFSVGKRNEFISQNPSMNLMDVSRQCGIAWKSLTEAEQKIYKDEYEANSQKYKLQKEQWWTNLTEDQKNRYLQLLEYDKDNKSKRNSRKQNKQLGKPKRGLTSFFIFLSKFPRESGISSPDFVKKASIAWRAAPDEEKMIYKGLAEQEAQRYKAELMDWERKTSLK